MIYLVRHGQAEGNQEHRYIGWSDPPLTALGQAQALALAELLRAEPIRRVIASDRVRAIETARPIAAALGRPPGGNLLRGSNRILLGGCPQVEIDPDLRELHFGRWEGRSPDELWAQERERYEAWLNDPASAPPGGESLSSFRERILAAYGRAGEGALLVTHGGPIRLLLAERTGEPFWSRPVAPGSAWRLTGSGITQIGTRE